MPVRREFLAFLMTAVGRCIPAGSAVCSTWGEGLARPQSSGSRDHLAGARAVDNDRDFSAACSGPLPLSRSPDELGLGPGLGLVGAAAGYARVPAVIALPLDHRPSERSRYSR